MISIGITKNKEVLYHTSLLLFNQAGVLIKTLVALWLRGVTIDAGARRVIQLTGKKLVQCTMLVSLTQYRFGSL